MKKITKILYIALIFSLIGTIGYGIDMELLQEDLIENKLEETYGINIIMPEDEEYINYKECLLVLDRGLRRFPDGVIKEITDIYLKNGIKTNIIVNKTEKISELYSDYTLNEDSANIYINTLKNSMLNETCVASENGFVHKMGHFISDYLFNFKDMENLKNEFEKLNDGFNYGNWDDSYHKAFVNKHSAMSFKDEIADLIWYTEIHPDILRNIDEGEHTIIHSKIKLLSSTIDDSFSSVTKKSKLWQEALPQEPDDWALDAINAMNEESLIPEEFEGIYKSYITKEDFYTLVLNVIENKLGKDNFIKSFNLSKQEDYVSIDPIRGEVYKVNPIEEIEIVDLKEKRLYEAHQIGLIDEGWLFGSKELMTRLEIAKLFSYIGKELGMDISEYEVIDYNDIDNVKESDKPFIYFVSSKGLLKGYGNDFKPDDFCTYQEAYLLLIRLYNML